MTPVEKSLAAADKLDALDAAATPGPWVYRYKNFIETPEIDITEADWGRLGDDGKPLHGYRLNCTQDPGAWRVEDVQIIAALRAVAGPLAASLRESVSFSEEFGQDVPVDVLAVADAILQDAGSVRDRPLQGQ